MFGSEEQGSAPEIPLAKTPSLAEIKKLVDRNMGIRATSEEAARNEMAQGVNGDFLAIADLSSLLQLNQENPLIKNWGKIDPTFLFRKMPLERLGEVFTNLEELPTIFVRSLRQFIKNTFAFSLYRDVQIGFGMTVGEFLELAKGKTGAFLIIESEEQVSGYDKEEYAGFGKAGRRYIKASEITALVSLTNEDWEKIRQKRAEMLGISETNSSKITARESFDKAEEDIVDAILLKIIQEIKEKVSSD